MEKIIITGGLGYIGTELCKIYSGESRFKKIIVIDYRFISERVKQITDWGMQFIQGNILDEKLMESILKDADVVYHLAGITDVAYTKTQSNIEKDKEIKEIGINGTRNIIKYVPKTCKIIFPSTHVVYEGLDKTKFDINETEPVKPILTYSIGKVQSEVDLIQSDLNYIIVRLGSVYGYSTDTMRINIMPNLFSKIASQNGTISLFSGGSQYKSLVNIIDVVRAMKFLAESIVKNEIFHLSNENMTIKDVAEICKKNNSNINIKVTDDEVPNLGYTLSNKKILSIGFNFLFNIENSIKEMISNWSEKNKIEALEYVTTGSKDYIDSRGKISNYELTEPINLIGYIESKPGTLRANHYHPIQEQKCLLIKGKYISVIKDRSDKKSNIETRLIKPGDMSVIKPNVSHAMIFLEDSIFLNLVRGERDHENYGITHTISDIIVDDKMRNDLINNYKTNCRSCNSDDLIDVISLGMSPLANNLINDINTKVEMYPLEMKKCKKCDNIQLSYTVPPSKMFDDYLYVSSTTKSFRDHFEKASKSYIEEFNLNSGSLVIDIGSNDGVSLIPLKNKGIKILGIEPAKNISKIANISGINTINSYFTKKVADDIISEYGKADLITASNVFAHSDNLSDIIKNVFRILKTDGTFIIEVQYVVDTIKDLTFDNIYHEHVNYWSATSLNKFLKNLNLCLYKIEKINTHGGSIRAYIKEHTKNIDYSVKNILDEETKFGISSEAIYKEFSKNIENLKNNVLKNINILKSKFDKISAYGSPAKATTLLNYFGIDNTMIDYTIEDNILKIGKIIPGVNIPIVSKEYCYRNLPDVIIVLAWNFFNEIKKNNQDLIDKGVIFISIKDLQNENFKYENRRVYTLS